MAVAAPWTEHVQLGRSGIEVSRIGVGSGYGIDAKSIERAFHEHGINYFYPSVPRRGKMNAGIRNLAAKHRSEIVVVSQTYDHFGFWVPGSIEKHIRTMGLDYADVLLLGWFNRFPNPRIMEGALKLKAEGKVRAIAMSGHHRPTFGGMAEDPNCPVDIFMIRYNAVHKGAEHDIFPHLPADDRPGILTYTTTCWGKLLKPGLMPPGEAPLTPGDCYRFVLSNPNVDMCLCGPGNWEQLHTAIQALEKGPMSDEELERARRIGDHIHGKGSLIPMHQ